MEQKALAAIESAIELYS
jgi:phage tail tape-measure protein